MMNRQYEVEKMNGNCPCLQNQAPQLPSSVQSWNDLIFMQPKDWMEPAHLISERESSIGADHMLKIPEWANLEGIKQH
jgi:hypothetical protein